MTQVINIPYTPRPVQQEIHDAMDAHRFSVIVAHRRMGKTVMCINQLVKAAAHCMKERPRYAYIAPFYAQAKTVAWDYLKHYTEGIPTVKRNESELWVEIPTMGGSRARIRLFGGENPDALRGQYIDGCVMDEVAQMKPNIWGEIVMPCLVDRQGWCAFIGTPAGFNLLFELYNKGLKDESWFAKVYPATATDVLSEDDLREARKTMSEAQYRQEFGCDFTASSEQVLIPLDLIIKATKRTNLPQTYDWAPIVIGVDVARFGDDQSVIYVRQGNHTIAVKKYRDLDLMTFTDYVAGAINKYNAAMTFVDVVGLGAGVVDRLTQLGYRNIMGANAGFSADNPKYKNKRAEMWDTMKTWLEEGGDIPDDPVLISELSSVQFKFDPSDRLLLEKKEDMKKRGLSSPDCFVAGTVIATLSGGVEIQNILEGDKVVTPFGERKVLKVWVSDVDTICTRSFGKRTLAGTPNHKIFTSKGLFALTKCNEESTISALSIPNLIKWRHLWQLQNVNFKEERIGFRQLHHIITQTTGLMESDIRRRYIEIYGSSITIRKYLKATVSTILTEIPKIIYLLISNSKNFQTIAHIISINDGKTLNMQSEQKHNCFLSTISQRLGIKTHSSNMNGNKLGRKGGKVEKPKALLNVLSAAKKLKRFFLPELGSVQLCVPNGAPLPSIGTGLNMGFVNTAEKTLLVTGERKTNDSVHTNVPQWREVNDSVKNAVGHERRSVIGAERCFRTAGITQRSFATQIVTTQSNERVRTYNLTVDVDNVYYANGVLVSNCADAISLSFFQQVQSTDWDEDNGGFYKYKGPAFADPATGY